MAYVGRDFDVSHTAESEPYAFDFTNDLAAGDAILSATWALTVESGNDATPSARLDGSPWIESPTITVQRIAGMVSGTVYVVRATVRTRQLNTLVLWSRIRCEVLPP